MAIVAERTAPPLAPNRADGTYDVVVVGGGAGGIGAALGAAETGASVLLVERYGFLGGAATNASVLAYCGLFKQGPEPVRCVAGVADRVLAELGRLGQRTRAHRSPTTGNWILPLETEPLKLALDRATRHPNLDVRLHGLLVAADREGERIAAVRIADHLGTSTIRARSFVDASGEADLAAVADVPVVTGGSGGSPLQAASMPLRIGGVPADVPLDRASLVAMVRAHNAADPDVPILRDDGGIILRMPGSNEIWWLVVDIVTDGFSAADLTLAEQTSRERAHAFVGALRRWMPGFGSAYLIGTGPQIGLRETRHVIPRRTVTEGDALAGRLAEDGVALAGWPMENHHAAGRPSYTSIGGDGVFHVPLDALRARDVENLWCAGRIIGADRAAFGSIRVMGTAFATGHAAGVAAALQAAAGPVRGDLVRATLVRQGALI